ncbi:transporter [Mesorhizobium sp. LHD-90]|uniref:transporter n=1 Tax=Mesorhizobium sp. LHD-90 TaxID=3071414 RepID=UPI0027E1949B|nr:transporter [Mesorhizobium sp. LHD-90]MDQ6435727.1 transporter [Mesorhizobium sp. LHD-90]
MLSAEEIQNGLTGAWRLMTGKADGLRALDLSADGFWNSFFSIAVALPAMILGWATSADQWAGDVGGISRAGVVLRLAVRDFGIWLLPLLGFALVARRAGLGDRFVAYVVASNWSSVVLAWMSVPIILVSLLPVSDDFVTLLVFLYYGLVFVLSWRLTNAAIGRGPAVATAVFTGMFIASLVALLALQGVLGLSVPYSTPTR